VLIDRPTADKEEKKETQAWDDAGGSRRTTAERVRGRYAQIQSLIAAAAAAAKNELIINDDGQSQGPSDRDARTVAAEAATPLQQSEKRTSL
jgi:hypothetical protein